MTTQNASAHWKDLAKSERDKAEFLKSRGLPYGDVSSYYARAATYDRTAISIDLEIQTGRPHCVSCLKDHPSHVHPHIG